MTVRVMLIVTSELSQPLVDETIYSLLTSADKSLPQSYSFGVVISLRRLVLMLYHFRIKSSSDQQRCENDHQSGNTNRKLPGRAVVVIGGIDWQRVVVSLPYSHSRLAHLHGIN